MPGDPEECRHHAARCAEMAATAGTPELKALLLELSAKWQALAVEAERVQAMLAKTRNASAR
jgi:hypothetical protein